MFNIFKLFDFGTQDDTVSKSGIVIRLARGSMKAHDEHPFREKAGNFSLVTDAPQLRFHDGKTPGGQIIALDPKIWVTIMTDYYPDFESY